MIVGPHDPFISAKLSRTYLSLKQYKKAIELAQPIYTLDENDASPALTLGLAYLALEEYKKAETALESALRLTPFDPTVRCNLQIIYNHLGIQDKEKREARACALVR